MSLVLIIDIHLHRTKYINIIVTVFRIVSRSTLKGLYLIHTERGLRLGIQICHFLRYNYTSLLYKDCTIDDDSIFYV